MKYPIILNLKRKKILIVGAGVVAYRRAKQLSSEKLDITVLSNKFNKIFVDLDIKKIKKKMTINNLFILENYDLVFAATNDKKINRRIVQYCFNKKILVNSVTSLISDFNVPANFKIGELIVSISTSGKAPFLSKKIKDDLEKKYSKDYLDIIYKIRDRLKKLEKKEKMTDLLSLDYEELCDYYEEICSGS